MHLNSRTFLILVGIFGTLVVGGICYFHATHRCVSTHPELHTNCQKNKTSMHCVSSTIDVCDAWVSRD